MYVDAQNFRGDQNHLRKWPNLYFWTAQSPLARSTFLTGNMDNIFLSLCHKLPCLGPRTSATQSQSRGTRPWRASTTTWLRQSCSSWTTMVGEVGYPSSLINSWTNLRWLLCEEGSARVGMVELALPFHASNLLATGSYNDWSKKMYVVFNIQYHVNLFDYCPWSIRILLHEHSNIFPIDVDYVTT